MLQKVTFLISIFTSAKALRLLLNCENMKVLNVHEKTTVRNVLSSISSNLLELSSEKTMNRSDDLACSLGGQLRRLQNIISKIESNTILKK